MTRRMKKPLDGLKYPSRQRLPWFMQWGAQPRLPKSSKPCEGQLELFEERPK